MATQSQEEPLIHSTDSLRIELTHSSPDATALLNFVRRPTAGASVLFAGSTRTLSRPEGACVPTTNPTAETTEATTAGGHAHTFTNGSGPPASPSSDYAPIESLTYSAYAPLALKTLRRIAETQRTKHALEAVAIAHRLGTVPVGEDSVVVAVSAMHRGAAWAGGEEVMEEVKRRAEIWKWEVFEGGERGWRGNAVDGGGREGQGASG